MILSIYGEIQIKESPYLGMFQALEYFVTLVNGWKPLTNFTKSSY